MNAAKPLASIAASPRKFGSWIGGWRGAATDLLFPPVCNFCGDGLEASDGQPILCVPCVERMRPKSNFLCPRCATPCPEIPAPDGFCPHCRGMKFAFAAVRTVGLYEGDLRLAVLQSKHHQHESLAMALGRQLAEVVRAQPFPVPIALVAPVPMHWLKRLYRGTNPSETLATSLAAALRLPLASDLIRCRRIMKKQSTLRPGERFQNVRRAYAAHWNYNIRGAAILLVDDVITTGASADAISKAFRRAGAAEVYVAAVARGTGVP